MPQRLTPLEVSLLALDTAHTPGHVGTVDIFDPGPRGLRLRGADLPDPRADRLRPALPATDSRDSRAACPAGLGRRRKLRPHLPCATLCAAAAGHSGPAPRARRSGDGPTARYGRGRCGRCIWWKGLEDDRLALLAKSHLCLVDGIDTVEIGQVLLDTTARPHAIPGDRNR